MPDVRGKAMLEGFITEAEVEDARALGGGRQQQLAKQDLAWRMARQVNCEGRFVPEIAAAIAEPEVEGDRAALPVDAGKSQPTSVGRNTGQRMVEISLPGIEKLAGIRRVRPSRNVLFAEFSEMRTNRLAIGEMPDLQRSLTPELSITPYKAFLVGSRLAQRRLNGEIERRSGPLLLLITSQAKPAGGFRQAAGGSARRSAGRFDSSGDSASARGCSWPPRAS